MHREPEKNLAVRAVELGRAGNGAALPELVELLKTHSSEVRRLAVSAIGKLAGLTDAAIAVATLRPVLRDTHPQVRQYAVKALKAYGAAAQSVLQDLRDLAANPAEKEYNRRDAALAVEVILEAVRIASSAVMYYCQSAFLRAMPSARISTYRNLMFTSSIGAWTRPTTRSAC